MSIKHHTSCPVWEKAVWRLVRDAGILWVTAVVGMIITAVLSPGEESISLAGTCSNNFISGTCLDCSSFSIRHHTYIICPQLRHIKLVTRWYTNMLVLCRCASPCSVAQLCPAVCTLGTVALHTALAMGFSSKNTGVAISSSSGSSWPRDRTHVSCLGGRFFYCWSIAEA